MSTIYRAYYNTIGYDKEVFFATFDAARKFIQTDVPGVDYHKGNFYIGCDSCKVNISDDSISIRQEIPEDDIVFYCGVEPFELPFDFKGDSFWKLSFVYGYASVMIYDDGGAPEIIGYFPSKKAGRKYAARTKWLQRFPRAWVRQGEEALRRDGVNGYGMDYLNLRKVRVY